MTETIKPKNYWWKFLLIQLAFQLVLGIIVFATKSDSQILLLIAVNIIAVAIPMITDKIFKFETSDRAFVIVSVLPILTAVPMMLAAAATLSIFQNIF
jgi:hypothetical protein